MTGSPSCPAHAPAAQLHTPPPHRPQPNQPNQPKTARRQVATTTSLASRIAALNCDFGDKLEADESSSQAPIKEDDEEPCGGSEDGGDGGGGGAAAGAAGRNAAAAGVARGAVPPAEEVVRLLAAREPPLQVCSRLFVGRCHPPIALKRLSMMQVEDFRQHGYVVVDGMLPREAAARLKAEALRLAARGKLSPAAGSSSGGLRATLDSSGRPSGDGTAAASGATRAMAAAAAARQQHGARQPRRAAPPAPPAPPPPPPGGPPRPSEQRLALQLGSPPADTAPFAGLLAALQEVQDDLHEFMRLKQRGRAEYALAVLPAGGASVPRHRDALPDDGAGYLTAVAAAAQTLQQAPQQQQQQQQQQQPHAGAGSHGTAAAAAGGGQCQQQPQAASGGASCNGSAYAAAAAGVNGGSPIAAAAAAAVAASPAAALSPAAASAAAAAAASAVAADPSLLRRVSIFVFLNPNWERDGGGCLRLWPPQRQSMLQQGGGGGGAAVGAGSAAAGRRSPTSSDAGTTLSEGPSECGSSIRLHHFLGSTTSSVVAEAASAAADHTDVASLDGRLSLADSADAEAGARCCGFEWVDAEEGMALDVAPLAGRAVVMLAGAVDHALVAPAAGAGDMAYARAWCS